MLTSAQGSEAGRQGTTLVGLEQYVAGHVVQATDLLGSLQAAMKQLAWASAEVV